MSANAGHVRQMELCDRTMFGDFVVARVSPPMVPMPRKFPKSAFKIPIESVESRRQKFGGEKVRDEKGRACELLNSLLFEIYNRRKCSLSGYTSSTSAKSQRIYRNNAELQNRNVSELRPLCAQLEQHVVRTGRHLVRRLKRRDALRRQQEALCDVIDDQLQKLRHASEESDMRFSLEPAPGDSGFAQWHSAMRMVAQLPGGIPPEFRRKLWLALAERHLAAKSVRWERVELDCFSEWSHPADGELGVQIVKDLHRTGCSLFCGESGQENQALLKRVLLAYARWNKAVGYCQGFNMLAALILQVTDKCESEALKLMIFLIEGVLPESYFADSLRGLSVDMAVFRELLRTRLPRLSRHLDTLQTAAKDGTTSYEPPLTNVFTMQWFLTLFCNCLPQPTVLRVWDLILLEGNEILLRTALAIWQVLSERIQVVRSADEFYCIMGVLTREILEFGIVDPNSLIKAVVAIGPLGELPSLREKYLYNINPWVPASAESRNKQMKVYGKEKIALDISALKKQYIKLRQRQRQAHIIFSAAVARQPSPKAPAVAMNHLLLGKSALVPAKRLGPPKGAIPPARQPQPSNATLHWKDAPHQDSSSSSSSSSTSSSDTELCDDPDQDDDLEETSQLPEDNRISSPIADGSSDNFGGNEDPTLAASDPPEDAEERDKDVVAEAADVAPQVDTTTTDLVVKISDIFDTTESCGAVVKDAFEFGKYSDSDEENVDFERFLESRVQCLKERSLGIDVEAAEKPETPPTISMSRKNSQRALEIIQENSLILHRILQCQTTRLTPSPPLPEDSETGVSLPDERLKEKVSLLEERLGLPEEGVSLPEMRVSLPEAGVSLLEDVVSLPEEIASVPEAEVVGLQETADAEISPIATEYHSLETEHKGSREEGDGESGLENGEHSVKCQDGDEAFPNYRKYLEQLEKGRSQAVAESGFYRTCSLTNDVGNHADSDEEFDFISKRFSLRTKAEDTSGPLVMRVEEAKRYGEIERKLSPDVPTTSFCFSLPTKPDGTPTTGNQNPSSCSPPTTSTNTTSFLFSLSSDFNESTPTASSIIELQNQDFCNLTHVQQNGSNCSENSASCSASTPSPSTPSGSTSFHVGTGSSFPADIGATTINFTSKPSLSTSTDNQPLCTLATNINYESLASFLFSPTDLAQLVSTQTPTSPLSSPVTSIKRNHEVEAPCSLATNFSSSSIASVRVSASPTLSSGFTRYTTSSTHEVDLSPASPLQSKCEDEVISDAQTPGSASSEFLEYPCSSVTDAIPVALKSEDRTPTTTISSDFLKYTSTFSSSDPPSLRYDTSPSPFKTWALEYPLTPSPTSSSRYDLRSRRRSSSESPERPSFASIIDSDFSRSLEEKYENLIERPSRRKGCSEGGSGESSDSVDRTRPLGLEQRSSGSGGRIFNPFPVAISSRQNKDVAVRLGLYKGHK